jgi:hypothetical protein
MKAVIMVVLKINYAENKATSAAVVRRKKVDENERTDLEKKKNKKERKCTKSTQKARRSIHIPKRTARAATGIAKGKKRTAITIII